MESIRLNVDGHSVPARSFGFTEGFHGIPRHKPDTGFQARCVKRSEAGRPCRRTGAGEKAGNSATGGITTEEREKAGVERRPSRDTDPLLCFHRIPSCPQVERLDQDGTDGVLARNPFSGHGHRRRRIQSRSERSGAERQAGKCGHDGIRIPSGHPTR